MILNYNYLNMLQYTLFLVDSIMSYSKYILTNMTIDFGDLLINMDVYFKYYSINKKRNFGNLPKYSEIDVIRKVLYHCSIGLLESLKLHYETTYKVNDILTYKYYHQYDYLYDEFFYDMYNNNASYLSLLPKDIMILIRKEVNNDIRIIDLTNLFNYN